MFIQTDIEKKPGLQAELIVWEAVKAYFESRQSFAFHSYPMFNHNFEGKKEIDILVIDKEIGLTVIEVKGLRIHQIENIQGHVWKYCDFYEKQGNPYQQGEKQLDMLCNRLEANPLLFRTLSKRVVVALPYISRLEWEAKGFHQLLHTPPILFKEDIENKNGINILENYYIYNANQKLSERQWSEMKRFFSIGNRNSAENYVSNYSRLFIFQNEQDFLQQKTNIENALTKGIKIFLFSYFPIDKKWVEDHQAFIDEYQLLIYQSNSLNKSPVGQSIFDGENFTQALQTQLEEDFPSFNFGQYKATHSPIKEHLMVTAGAGTGKTHVMIDRILFLIATGNINLKDVIMITFTNESTNEMKERLHKKLIGLFKLTGQTKYLILAEDIKEMQIRTIHSFAKMILVSLAHEIGYGRNVQLRSFIKKKKEIIEKLANQFIQTHDVGELVKLDIPHYELVNIMFSFWEEMEKKGLTKQEIIELHWGEANNPKYKSLQGLFQFVFERCEDLLDVEKKNENAVSMGDLIRKIKDFSRDERKMKQLQLNKYVFVDEFQDSDNVQIEMVASLANYLNYHLFVVGDIKQSIYRFRGADYKSFDVLAKKVQAKFNSVPLNQNYRTTTSILNKLDKVFAVWGKQNWLSYAKDDVLVGVDGKPNISNDIQYPRYWKLKECQEKTVEAIQSSMNMTKHLPKDKNRKIAVIVRTNAQALTVNKWCEEAGISTLQNLDGTFFTSDAVRDFKILLDGLLYPEEAKYVVNALQTPYFRYEIPYQILLPFSGDSRSILHFIHSKIGDEFTKYVDQLKTTPVMAIIQKIISEKRLLQHLEGIFSKKADSKQATLHAKQYQKNLFHLMNMIQQTFDNMNCTLFHLHEWLTLQMRTNRTENEPMLELADQTVEITTVHRSKGLEYHTVIIPKTDDQYEKNRTTFYIEDENEIINDNRRVGWYIKKHDSNSYYADLSTFERNEIHKEETRLLYVAMTRTKERLVILLPERKIENSWSSLIKVALSEVQNGR